MKDTNVLTLIGRLTSDPVLKYLADGTPVCAFSLAVGGWKKDTVSFFEITAWKKTAELIAEYCAKGKQVCITGELSQDRWQDKESGKNRSKVKITANSVQFLGSKSDGASDAEKALNGQS